AAGSERRADRQLALADRRPDQEQVREIATGDQQHEGDGRLEQQQREPTVTNDHVEKGLEDEIRAGLNMVRELTAKLLSCSLQSCLRTRKRQTWSQPADGEQIPDTVSSGGIELQGRPEIGLKPTRIRQADRVESRSERADDHVRDIVEREGTADDVWIRPKSPLPESVTQHCHMATVNTFFIDGERPPNRNGCAQHLEKSRAHLPGHQVFWLTSAGEIATNEPIRGDSIKHARLTRRIKSCGPID